MDLEEFRRALAETVAWCERQGRLADTPDSLRTPALRPTNRSMVPDKWGEYEYTWGIREQNAAVLSTLAQARAEELRKVGDYPEDVPDIWAEGRLLFAAPWVSDWSGLSEIDSKGFVDGLDVPAWDTWVCCGQEAILPDPGRGYVGIVDCQPPSAVAYLLCWIPPSCVGLVEEGIHVNPVECFFWARDYKQKLCNTPFLQHLDAAGWLR